MSDHTPQKMDPQSSPSGHGTALCGAKLRRREGTCRHPAGWGTSHNGYGPCKFHMGNMPNVSLGATRTALQARVSGELVRREIVPVTEPTAELSRAVGETIAFRDLCRDLLAEITDGWTRTNPIAGNEETKAAVQLYAQAQRDATKDLATMVKLDIKDRVAAMSELKTAAWMAAIQQIAARSWAHEAPTEQIIAEAILDTQEDK